MKVKELNKEQLEELRFAMIFEDDSKYNIEHQPTDEEVLQDSKTLISSMMISVVVLEIYKN